MGVEEEDKVVDEVGLARGWWARGKGVYSGTWLDYSVNIVSVKKICTKKSLNQ